MSFPCYHYLCVTAQKQNWLGRLCCLQKSSLRAAPSECMLSLSSLSLGSLQYIHPPKMCALHTNLRTNLFIPFDKIGSFTFCLAIMDCLYAFRQAFMLKHPYVPSFPAHVEQGYQKSQCAWYNNSNQNSSMYDFTISSYDIISAWGIMHVHSLLYECIRLEDSNELCDYLLENLKGPTKGSPKLENRFEAVKLYLPGQPSIHRCECDLCNTMLYRSSFLLPT